jgi:hypothetical protein
VRPVAAALAATLFAATAGAAVDEAALAQCAATADPAARLACYDALAGRPAAPATTPAPAAAPPAASAAPADFGLPPPKPEKGKDVRPAIHARVVGELKSWRRGTVFRLDNGQVWKAVGDEDEFYPGIPDNPEVTIQQNWFGAYWMDIKAIGRSVKVKRVS